MAARCKEKNKKSKKLCVFFSRFFPHYQYRPLACTCNCKGLYSSLISSSTPLTLQHFFFKGIHVLYTSDLHFKRLEIEMVKAIRVLK